MGIRDKLSKSQNSQLLHIVFYLISNTIYGLGQFYNAIAQCQATPDRALTRDLA